MKDRLLFRRVPGWAILVVGITISTIVGCSSRQHPSDAALSDLLRDKNGAFNEVVAMLRVDSTMTRVAPSFTRATGHWNGLSQKWIEDATISVERRNEYRRQFREIGAEAGVSANRDRSFVSFHVSTEGLSIGGSSKGIAYCTSPPTSVVESLDNYSCPGKAGTAYVHLEGPWYIYLDWTN